MRSTKWRFFSCWLIIVGLLCPPVVAADVPLLRQGHRGPEVVVLQDLLASLGYLSGEVDGIFGPNTKRSVVNFQKDEGLVSDGIVGVQTWRRLQAKAPVRDPELVLWEEVDLLFPHGSAATIVDLVTGRSLQVRRYHGHLHADVEPLTAADTKVLKSLYGGCFSWERRAVALEIGGRRIAASMNGFPHGSGSINNNGFSGHFCVHFLGSRLHLDGTMHRSHQEKVLEAAGYSDSPLWFQGDRTR